MTIILIHASLSDAWKVTHPDTDYASAFNALEVKLFKGLESQPIRL
jgi:hypothetical protein